MNENKLTGKDLINIGIYSAIYEAKQQSTTSIGVTAPHGCG